MRICIVHNEYGKYSGEEAAVDMLASALASAGHAVCRFTRSSADIEEMPLGKARAFFSGIYSGDSRDAFRRLLAAETPDIVHLHNVFPLISPSILPECRAVNVPVVLTLHNYRLICPNALFLRDGTICRDCSGGHEWHCVAHNCERSLPRSVGYALRTAVARRKRWFLDNVSAYVCLTKFQRYLFASEGYPDDRLHVIPPGYSAPLDASASSCAPGDGEFALYAGRVSDERDIPTLMAAALQCREIPIKVAGSYWRMPQAPRLAPRNVEFIGEVKHDELSQLYAKCRFVVFPTRCYEGFPTVILEAMAHGRPVICTDIGGLKEIVQDNVTGLLYNYGNPADLAEKINALWSNISLCNSLGRDGLARVNSEYSTQRFLERTLALYASLSHH